MGKKRYVKPEIKEESYILTVRAWATTTNVAIQVATEATTNVFAQSIASTETNVAVQNSSVFVQAVASR